MLRALALRAGVPRPHGVEEETPRESEVDQRVQTGQRWGPARGQDPQLVAASGWGPCSPLLSALPPGRPPRSAFILSPDPRP